MPQKGYQIKFKRWGYDGESFDEVKIEALKSKEFRRDDQNIDDATFSAENKEIICLQEMISMGWLNSDGLG